MMMITTVMKQILSVKQSYHSQSYLFSQ